MLKRYSNYAGALLFLLFAGQGLRAQSNTVELFGGVSFSKANPETPLPRQWMTGWVASANGYAARWFGVGAEFSGQFGTIPAPSSVAGAPGLPYKEYSYLVGPQFRFLNQKRVQSSFRLLVGGVFGQVNVASSATPQQVSQLGAAGYGGFNQTKFAALFAVPVDVGMSSLLAIRVEPGLYLTNFNKNGQGNFRFSVGPVFRFGHREK
jgi:hypothetical protein